MSCLPVVKNGRLVGLVSEIDFMSIADQLLQSTLLKEQRASEREFES